MNEYKKKLEKKKIKVSLLIILQHSNSVFLIKNAMILAMNNHLRCNIKLIWMVHRFISL